MTVEVSPIYPKWGDKDSSSITANDPARSARSASTRSTPIGAPRYPRAPQTPPPKPSSSSGANTKVVQQSKVSHGVHDRFSIPQMPKQKPSSVPSRRTTNAPIAFVPNKPEPIPQMLKQTPSSVPSRMTTNAPIAAVPNKKAPTVRDPNNIKKAEPAVTKPRPSSNASTSTMEFFAGNAAQPPPPQHAHPLKTPDPLLELARSRSLSSAAKVPNVPMEPRVIPAKHPRIPRAPPSSHDRMVPLVPTISQPIPRQQRHRDSADPAAAASSTTASSDSAATADTAYTAAATPRGSKSVCTRRIHHRASSILVRSSSFRHPCVLLPTRVMLAVQIKTNPYKVSRYLHHQPHPDPAAKRFGMKPHRNGFSRGLRQTLHHRRR